MPMDATNTNRTVLLSSGHVMPIVGLGTFRIPSEDISALIDEALTLGYRHFDTAFLYQNEAAIGDALKTAIESERVKRQDLFITTKLPVNGMQPDAVEHFFQKSLSLLQLDYVDLYLIHCPVASKRVDDDYDFFREVNGVYDADNTVDLVETWKILESLVDRGLVKSIGLSNFNSQQIQRICDAARIQPAVLQVECHAYLPQLELHEFCKKLKIAFTAYAPIGAPGFRGAAPYATTSLIDDPTLKPLCEKHQKTTAQILLRYLVQRGIIVIPKTVNSDRLKENIQIFDFNLSDEDFTALNAVNCNKRYFRFDFLPGMTNHPEYPFNIPF